METIEVLLPSGEKAVVKKKIGFLRTPEGKLLLGEVKDLPWNEILARLPWKQRAIESALSFHSIKKNRPSPKHVVYDDETIDIIIQAFENSHHLAPRSSELNQLKERLLEAVEKRLGRKSVTWNQIDHLARSLPKDRMRKVSEKILHPLHWSNETKPASSEKEFKLELRKFPGPPVLQIPKEIWDASPDEVRVGAMSRIDWKDNGARAAIVLHEFTEVFVPMACRYNVLNGGLVSRRDIDARIEAELAPLNAGERSRYRKDVENHVLTEIANELNSIIPLVKKPPRNDGGEEYVRLYIIPSRILDGVKRRTLSGEGKKELVYGEEVGRRLQDMRPDIRLYKTGGDTTRIKGIGATPEEAKEGQLIAWINPKKPRLPGQYASTSPEAEIREESAAAEYLPAIWVAGGWGSSISKPGDGERPQPFITLPVSHIPMPRREGEPSIALNQVGCRIIITYSNGERLIQTWSMRDLAKNERSYITGLKEGANLLHRQIVEAIKNDPTRRGLTIGELADQLDVNRADIEREITFLVERKPLDRKTWPGLYNDPESDRYNLHRDWLQERLRYPWPYNKDYQELRRLLAGCLHAGYNTTDYVYWRRRIPEYILRFDIKVLEILGDLIAGLKHDMIHKGQILGSLNYTEQEVFAAELIGTVIYDIFVHRFEKFVSAKNGQRLIKGELENWINESMMLLLYIVGNHDAWQSATGHTPGFAFKSSLISLLKHHLATYLNSKGMFALALFDIVDAKIVELPEGNAVYTFPGGITTELLHPSKGRTKTVSQRAEETFSFSKCNLVDSANYHTAIVVEKWEPDRGPDKPGLGQRHAVQAGAITPWTQFENGQLKIVDFGAVYSGVRYKDGRIFMTEHMFLNKRVIKAPLPKETDVTELKKKLGLLLCPVQTAQYKAE